MNNHRYILQPYKGMNSRYRCPQCGKGKTFTRYIDTQTGGHLADHAGRCERVDNCGYHCTPKQHFEATKPLFETLQKPTLSYTLKKALRTKNVTDCYKMLQTEAVSFIPANIFRQSLKNHNANHFVTFLTGHFGAAITNELISRYFIGTSKHWPGATVFWQIDAQGKIRTGKIMLYSPATGKRIKEPYNCIGWVHTALKLPAFDLQQCLFGSQLLRGNTRPVAVCESEKGAIIGSVYLPQFIWIAAGSKEGLTAEKCKALAGRNVTLFPDLSTPKPGKPSTFEAWSEKAKAFGFIVSDLLERKGSEAERKQGLDLADYLLRFPVAAFTKEPLQLVSSNIEHLPTSHYTGNDFEQIIIQGIRAKDGCFYDLLFTAGGELIQPGQQPDTVNRFAAWFGKRLQPALFDNTPCWVHCYPATNNTIQTA